MRRCAMATSYTASSSANSAAASRSPSARCHAAQRFRPRGEVSVGRDRSAKVRPRRGKRGTLELIESRCCASPRSWARDASLYARPVSRIALLAEATKSTRRAPERGCNHHRASASTVSAPSRPCRAAIGRRPGARVRCGSVAQSRRDVARRSTSRLSARQRHRRFAAPPAGGSGRAGERVAPMSHRAATFSTADRRGEGSPSHAGPRATSSEPRVLQPVRVLRNTLVGGLESRPVRESVHLVPVVLEIVVADHRPRCELQRPTRPSFDSL